MKNKKILNEVLENTRIIKNVILEQEKVNKEKSKKSKSAQRRAEQKFKMVGTKLNEEELIQFKEFLEEKGLNTNQYIKSLIQKDMNIHNQEKTIEKKFIWNKWIQRLLKIKIIGR